MNEKEIERAAYLAAHRILSTNLRAAELAGPGAQRSRMIDAIAGIIKDVFELHGSDYEGCRQREAAIMLDAPKHARPVRILQLPLRKA